MNEYLIGILEAIFPEIEVGACCMKYAKNTVSKLGPMQLPRTYQILAWHFAA